MNGLTTIKEPVYQSTNPDGILGFIVTSKIRSLWMLKSFEKHVVRIGIGRGYEEFKFDSREAAADFMDTVLTDILALEGSK